MGGEFSLLSGWLPVTVQVVAAGVVAGAVGWRTRRWRLRWVPAVALLGVVTAVAAAVRFASSTAGLAEQRRRQAAPSAFLGARYTQSLAAGIHSRGTCVSRGKLHPDAPALLGTALVVVVHPQYTAGF